MQQVKIAFADDHALFRHALVNIIDSYKDFKVTIQADNGQELINLLSKSDKKNFPDIVLLDISMPIMNGVQTTELLKKKYPTIKILIVTMLSDDYSMLQLIKGGVNGYITKDVTGDVLYEALNEIATKGSYFSNGVKEKIIQSLQNEKNNNPQNTISVWNTLTENEKRFVRLSCSEKTYAELAEEMSLSPRTIEAHRQIIFSKFGVKTRVGLALAIMRNNLL